MTATPFTASQARTVTTNLRYALRHAAGLAGDEHLHAAAEALPEAPPRTPHPDLPAVGATATRQMVVRPEDTAAALGHPDETVTVLASPRLGLWFEMVSCELLPAPDAGPTTVGAGILVHHLAPSHVGERLTIEARVAHVDGTRVLFDCLARSDGSDGPDQDGQDGQAGQDGVVVGTGTHHRALLAR